mgnify:CR=1 FL=1
MKKKCVILVLLIMIVGILFSIPFVNKKEQKEKVHTSVSSPEINVTEENKYEQLIQNYGQNVIAFIELPGVFIEPVGQAADNDYYLTHNIQQEEDSNGAIYLDYRIHLDQSPKFIIYGHSDPKLSLPFASLARYHDESFFYEHNIIYLYTKEKTYTFQIFSSYVETSDFDYLNLESYNGLTWLEHLQKLKNKSQYQTDLSLEENKKVLVLQTCSFDAKYKNYRQKYRVVVAIEQ